MAVTYEDRFQYATKYEFQQAVAIAAVKTGLSIMGETETGFTPEYFAKRRALAEAVINSPPTGSTVPEIAKKFSYLVAATLNIPTQNPTNDQDLQDQVLTLWNDLSGVSAVDLA